MTSLQSRTTFISVESMPLRHCSSVSFRNGAAGGPPVLVTRMSTCPKRATVSSIPALQILAFRDVARHRQRLAAERLPHRFQRIERARTDRKAAPLRRQRLRDGAAESLRCRRHHGHTIANAEIHDRNDIIGDRDDIIGARCASLPLLRLREDPPRRHDHLADLHRPDRRWRIPAVLVFHLNAAIVAGIMIAVIVIAHLVFNQRVCLDCGHQWGGDRDWYLS